MSEDDNDPLTVLCRHTGSDDNPALRDGVDGSDAEPTTLNTDDHGTLVSGHGAMTDYGTRLDWESRAWKVTCPDCDRVHYLCPVCHDANGGPGWFRGEDSGEMLACHNCNAREAMRQDRGY